MCRGVRVPFSKEPGTHLKNRLRARWCLDIDYLSFYNKLLGVPENGEPAWVSSPRFSETRVPVSRNLEPTVDFASRVPSFWERKPKPDTPNHAYIHIYIYREDHSYMTISKKPFAGISLNIQGYVCLFYSYYSNRMHLL